MPSCSLCLRDAKLSQRGYPGPSAEEEGRVSELPTMVALGDDYPELRESVHKICERYPGEYWRKLEAEQAYPTEFITELTQGGFLAPLIPEEYGGSGLPPSSSRRSTRRAAQRAKGTPRCISWAPCCGMAARSRSGAICQRSPRAS